MAYRIAQESLAKLWPEMDPLMSRHKDEVGPYADWKLSPDYPTYTKLEELGRLRTWTARDQLGEGQIPIEGTTRLSRVRPLVGYLIMVIAPHMHYSAQLCAYADVLFISPEHRANGCGLRLLRTAEKDLRAMGVSCIVQRTKHRQKLNIGRLFDALGYEPMDVTWAKRLDDTEEAGPGIPAVPVDPRDFLPHDAVR